MDQDTQIIHHLWWLRSFLNRQWENKEYKDIIRKDLDSDSLRELELLIAYIRSN